MGGGSVPQRKSCSRRRFFLSPVVSSKNHYLCADANTLFSLDAGTAFHGTQSPPVSRWKTSTREDIHTYNTNSHFVAVLVNHAFTPRGKTNPYIKIHSYFSRTGAKNAYIEFICSSTQLTIHVLMLVRCWFFMQQVGFISVSDQIIN